MQLSSDWYVCNHDFRWRIRPKVLERGLTIAASDLAPWGMGDSNWITVRGSRTSNRLLSAISERTRFQIGIVRHPGNRRQLSIEATDADSHSLITESATPLHSTCCAVVPSSVHSIGCGNWAVDRAPHQQVLRTSCQWVYKR